MEKKDGYVSVMEIVFTVMVFLTVDMIGIKDYVYFCHKRRTYVK